MPALTSRVTLRAITAEGDDDDTTHPQDTQQEEEPEDLLFSSLATIFPDDAPNLHGDSHSSILYTSPYLPLPLHLRLADPSADEDRKLFSHYLWNAALLLAELLEGAALKDGNQEGKKGRASLFDVRGLSVLEMGSGTGLPSIMAGLVGAKRVVATDYPSETILEPLRRNITRNLTASRSLPGAIIPSSVEVHGHAWGDLTPHQSTSFPLSHRHTLDRILLADCLWMPWQHDPLLQSVTYFLSLSPTARCLCIGACHTGREVVARFFERQRLKKLGLEVEEIWERDVDGKEREWEEGREEEDPAMRKRWCIVAVLRRVEGWTGDDD